MRRLIEIVAAIALSSLPVAALCQEPPSQVEQPVWMISPPTAALPARFRGEDYRSNVRLVCTVSQDALTACQPSEVAPESFLQAAQRAASFARIASLDGQGEPTNGRQVSVTVGFPIPVMLETPTQPVNLVGRPVWRDRPSQEDIATAYPSQARDQGITGNVFLECTVGDDGRLHSCRSIGTSGEGFHAEFAAAALTLASRFRVGRNDADGQATTGKIVRASVAFRLQ